MEPNILITNSCNQSCEFCFAKKEMKRPLKERQMSFEKFVRVINKLQKISASESIKIMGGEPTLHPEFRKIIRVALTKYRSVQLFTNGLFPSSTADFLKTAGKKMNVVFNASTPGFQTKKGVRDLMLTNINKLAGHSHVVLSFTYGESSPDTLKQVPLDIIRKVDSIRLGISNPQTQFSQKIFKRLGATTFKYIKKIHAIDKNKAVLLNCGFTPCMFDKQQTHYLLKNHILQPKEWGCFGKDGAYDIGIDGKAFSCFVYSDNKEVINADTDKRLFLSKYLTKGKKAPRLCNKCAHFMKDCPGPCI